MKSVLVQQNYYEYWDVTLYPTVADEDENAEIANPNFSRTRYEMNQSCLRYKSFDGGNFCDILDHYMC